MQIILNIPKEFEDHYNKDRFRESLERVNFDVRSLKLEGVSGRYELELLDMLIAAFDRSILPSHAAKLIMNSVYGKCATSTEYLEEDEELLIPKVQFEKFNKSCEKEGDKNDTIISIR